jgi:hypothetical protein
MEVEVVQGLVRSYQTAMDAGDRELGVVDKKILVAAVAASVAEADDYLATRVVGGDKLVEELQTFATHIAKEDLIGKTRAQINAWAKKKASEARSDAMKGFTALGVVGVVAPLTGFVTNVSNVASGIGEAIESAGRGTGVFFALLLAGGVPGAIYYGLIRSATAAAPGVAKAPAAVWDAADRLGTGAEQILGRGVTAAEREVFGPGRESPALKQPKEMRFLAKFLIVLGAVGLLIGALVFARGVADGFESCSKSKSVIVTTRPTAKTSTSSSGC